MEQYESGAIKVNWFGVDVSTGWVDGTFLEITPIGPKGELNFGADGKATNVKFANRGATITLTLKQTAPANVELAAVAAAQDVIGALAPIAPFTVEDPVGGTTNYFVALNAILTQGPSQSYGPSLGEKVWIWTCESYFDTDDVGTFTSALGQYINP